MVKCNKTTQCIKWARYPQGKKIFDELQTNNAILDDVQKKLEDYMETKRSAFPRFYFLSNDELIDILANSTDLSIIQQHLKTCFDNVVKLDINESDEVEAMNSSEKENVKFKKPIKTKVPVEVWLLQLQMDMILNLQFLMK